MQVLGVYYIQNIEDGKIYVGSSIFIKDRWRTHKFHLRKNTHCNQHLQAAWNIRGENSFIFGIIERIRDVENLLEREQYWIDVYQSHLNRYGYNMAPVAGNMRGFKFSKESKSKNSSFFRKGNVPWNKGKKMTGEYRENFLTAMSSENMKKTRRKESDHFRHTEDTRKKIGEAVRGKIRSEEIREKMRDVRMGKKMPPKHKENCIKAWGLRKLNLKTKTRRK